MHTLEVHIEKYGIHILFTGYNKHSTMFKIRGIYRAPQMASILPSTFDIAINRIDYLNIIRVNTITVSSYT